MGKSTEKKECLGHTKYFRGLRYVFVPPLKFLPRSLRPHDRSLPLPNSSHKQDPVKLCAVVINTLLAELTLSVQYSCTRQHLCASLTICTFSASYQDGSLVQ